MIVWVAGHFHGILNELLKCVLLADEFDEFRFATASAKHHQFLFLHKEFLDGATLFLVEKLVDFDSSSTRIKQSD